MLNVDFIFEIITTLIGLAWIFMSRKFSTGTADGVPRAEYFPVRVGITLIIVSMILAIKGLKDKRKYFNRKEWSKENIKVFLLTILAVVVFIILQVKVSYILASFILLSSLGYFYRIKLIKNIIISVIFSVGTYLLFNNVLQVMLNLK